MSIQDALYTSESSLQLLSQQTNSISNNLANASTPGYDQQSVDGTAAIANGMAYGVLAEPIQRLSDSAAAAVANQTTSSAAYSKEMVSVLTPYTAVLGQASDSTSLSSVISSLGSALTTLSNTPSDTTAQTAAVTAAQTVADTLNNLSSAVDTGRETADANIATGVAAVNSTLDKLAANQTAMQVAAGAGQSVASFQDTQDQLVASLSSYLPVHVLQNGNNNIIVTTDQGTTLFDGVANHLSFTSTATITSASVVGTSASNLSEVTVGGQAIATSQSGSIAADLQLRDVTLPLYQSQLDQVAGNLITQFQNADPTVDNSALVPTPTASTSPPLHTSATAGNTSGLFVNGNGPSAAITSPTTGLAGTIAVNTNVVNDPGLVQSGVYGTPSSSTAGDNSTILDFLDALSNGSSTSPGTSYTAAGLPTTATVSNAAAQLAGYQQNTMTTWTNQNTTNAAQATSANTTLTGVTGVSVDDQLQRLMIVQQTYSASAEVIQAASNMLLTLLSDIA